MTFLGLEARKDLPKVPYPTALDYFVFISFTYIFSTVVQVNMLRKMRCLEFQSCFYCLFWFSQKRMEFHCPVCGKGRMRTSQASVKSIPHQSSTTFSMTLLGAMNSHIQVKRVCQARELNLPETFCFPCRCSKIVDDWWGKLLRHLLGWSAFCLYHKQGSRAPFSSEKNRSSSGPGPGPRSGPGQVLGQVQKVQGLRTKDLDLGYTLNLVYHH